MKRLRVNGLPLAARCPVALAVSVLVAVNAARAAEPEPSDEVKALTIPASVLELGLGGVSDSAFKFGEYNGLEDKIGRAHV